MWMASGAEQLKWNEWFGWTNRMEIKKSFRYIFHINTLICSHLRFTGSRDLCIFIFNFSIPKPKPFSSPTTAHPELMSGMQCTQINENKFSFQFDYVYVHLVFLCFFFILYYMELVLYYPDVMLNVKWSCFFYLNKI